MVVDTGDADQGLPGARQLWAGRFQAVLSTQSLAEADPRCALTLGAPTDGDLQQADRLTALGNCRPLRDSDGDVATRYLRYFPQGEMYFRELNFRFHRFEPRRFYFNGGFGTARPAIKGTHRAPYCPATRTTSPSPSASTLGDWICARASVSPAGLSRHAWRIWTAWAPCWDWPDCHGSRGCQKYWNSPQRSQSRVRDFIVFFR